MVQITVRKIGNSLGVILPAEAAATLGVVEGDRLFLTEAPDGLRVTACDPEFERKVQVAENGMRRYRNALRELAR